MTDDTNDQGGPSALYGGMNVMDELKVWMSNEYIKLYNAHQAQGTSASYNRMRTMFVVIEKVADLNNDREWPIISKWADDNKLWNRDSLHEGGFAVGFTPQEQAIMDDAGKELRRQLGVVDWLPLHEHDPLIVICSDCTEVKHDGTCLCDGESCDGCLFMLPTGICSVSSSCVPDSETNKITNDTGKRRCGQYTPITDEHRKAMEEYNAPLVTGDGLLQDHNLPGANQDDLCAVPPGNVVNMAAVPGDSPTPVIFPDDAFSPDVIQDVYEQWMITGKIGPLSSGRFDAKKRHIVFDKPTSPTINLDLDDESDDYTPPNPDDGIAYHEDEEE